MRELSELVDEGDARLSIRLFLYKGRGWGKCPQIRAGGEGGNQPLEEIFEIFAFKNRG